MVDPFELAGAVFELVGPFVIPVIIFVGGMIGYGVLVALGRAGLVGGGRSPEDGDGNGDGHERERPDGPGGRGGDADPGAGTDDGDGDVGADGRSAGTRRR